MLPLAMPTNCGKTREHKLDVAPVSFITVAGTFLVIGN